MTRGGDAWRDPCSRPLSTHQLGLHDERVVDDSTKFARLGPKIQVRQVKVRSMKTMERAAIELSSWFHESYVNEHAMSLLMCIIAI